MARAKLDVRTLRPVYGWAWAIRSERGGWKLCYWASPYKRDLIADGKPSPEAVAVRVRIGPAREIERAAAKGKRCPISR